jgi:hypothetical protein
VAVDHRRGSAEPIGGALEKGELGWQADLVEAERAGPLARIRPSRL